MDYFLVLYFLAGAAQNFLFILNMRFVHRDRPLPASAFSFFVSILSVWVLYDIITRIGESRGLVAIVIYSLGFAAGTYGAMKLKLEKVS
ncbi:MAG: hypothetical protein HY221_01835 [Candidatus Sungbacteria bacterium]|uniref:Uncharacterized protein n=1 Tax=Candidatus Sungiibacteriota bacterium TaxID=2750080 RepID=A0A932R070_9BACT|nr:hypothetical protein [Candidatus Sungbacteria bacterium]